uniref:GRAM domain-containing protein n=1 Tax=Heterorhabditis bacteriophora TaxID=37862 RepID=A0A1I7WTH2_HETBA
MSRRSRTSDEIDVISSSDESDNCIPPAREPVSIRGVGHITMFGLNSRFDTEFPSELTGRIAPEELSDTLSRINSVLKRQVQMSRKTLISVDGYYAVFYFAVAHLGALYGQLCVLIGGLIFAPSFQMSKSIKTPTNQKTLTNVAVVRMKKIGKRFEIILDKGDLQVSDKERQAATDQSLKEVDYE